MTLYDIRCRVISIIDCLKTEYYKGSIRNIEIIPVDDTHFLGLIETPGYGHHIYAFRLTPR